MTKKTNISSRNVTRNVSTITVTAILAIALMLSGCNKGIKDDIKDLQSRVGTIEQAVNALQSATVDGALVKSVTATDDGWRIEFTSGTPAAIEVLSEMLSVADNGDGTITFTLSDGTEFTFRRASEAGRIEIIFPLPDDMIYIYEGDYEMIKFRVNPSNAYVPVGSGEAIADWALDQIGTRASYVNEPEMFELVTILPDGDREGQYIAWIKCKDTDGSYSSSEYVMALVLTSGDALVSSSAFRLGIPWWSSTPSVFIKQEDTVAEIEAAIQEMIDDGYTYLVVKGSKTNAAAPLTIDFGSSYVEILWKAAYSATTAGTALKLDGNGWFGIEDGSVNLTCTGSAPALVTEGVDLDVYNGGSLTVKGDVLATDYIEIYSGTGGDLFIDGGITFEGVESGYMQAWGNGKITVTGGINFEGEDYAGGIRAYESAKFTVAGGITFGEGEYGYIGAYNNSKISITGDVAFKGEYAYLDAYGDLFIDGNVTFEGEDADIYVEGNGKIFIDGNVTFTEAGAEIWSYDNAKLTVTGNVSAEKNESYWYLVMSYNESEVEIGGDLTVGGVALVLEDAAKATVGGNVTANGDAAIGCIYEAVALVKGNVSAPNGIAIYMYYEGLVIIDGEVTVDDYDYFIYDANSDNYLAFDDYSATNTQSGYDAYYEYTDGDWYVYILKSSNTGSKGSSASKGSKPAPAPALKQQQQRKPQPQPESRGMNRHGL